jgi:aquaporin NIP
MKKYLAEFFGTYGMLFSGTGAIIINNISGGAITHPGIAITFGLIVMCMIYTYGEISGAHFNPAVTIAFWVAKRLPGKEVLPYIISQFSGAILASLTLKFLFIDQLSYGETSPKGSDIQSFILEIILTFFLMTVILNVSTGAKEKGITAGIAIGGIVALSAMFAGPISGASMNPARSLAPALVSFHFQSLWIYFIAPVIGSVLSVYACLCVQEEGCCSPVNIEEKEVIKS